MLLCPSLPFLLLGAGFMEKSPRVWGFLIGGKWREED